MIYYTIKDKTDGFGAQYHAILSGIAFSKYNNYIYLHTPFIIIAHNLDANKLNKFIGINNDYLIKNNLLPSKYDKIINKKFSKEVHFSNNPSLYYTEETLKIIRDFYYNTEKKIINNIDIAIHIRRGDVNKKNIRFTNNNIYFKLINQLIKKYPHYKITIFSQGKYQDFSDLGLNETNFKLNIDIMETFHSLVSAKILVISKSSFSYSAALLNTNIIYYLEDFINWWHKPLNNWVNVNTLL